ncbi:MAG: winged helix-turn-helix transcriptional regulator [Thermoplasmatota archaeon]
MNWKMSPWWRTALVAVLALSASAVAINEEGQSTKLVERQSEIAWGTVEFAELRVGDGATYSHHVIEGDQTREYPESSFVLSGTVELPGPDAIPREYVHFASSGSWGLDGLAGSWKGVETDFEFMDASGRVAGRFLEGTSNAGQDGCDFSCPEQETSYKREIRHYGPDYTGRTPCGIMHALQGKAIEVDSWNGTLFSACARPLGGTFQAQARADDNETIIFDSAGHEVWIHPDVPFPVRYVEPLGGNRTYVATLLEISRGTQPIPTQGFENLPVAPATLLGPSEAGIRHPYPLSEAFLDAQTNGEVRSWLDAHEAYLRWATHGFESTSELNATTWQMALSDGTSSIKVTVLHELRTGTVPLDPEDPTSLFERVRVEVEPREVNQDPPPAEAPQRLPSVATLWDRWSLATGQEGANSWSYAWYCIDDCTSTRVQLSGGLSHRFDETQRRPVTVCINCTSGATGNIRDAYLVVLDGEDIVYAELDQSVQARHEAGNAPPTAEPLLVASAAAQPSRQMVVERGWSWPPAEVVAGATVFALVLTVLHHVFPGLFGLFSRLRPEAALAHDARQQLHALIAEQPGLHVRELARRSGMPRGTVEHHLRKLEETGHVQRIGHASRTTYAVNSVERETATASPFLHDATRAGILKALAHSDASSLSGLAKLVGVSPSTCHFHLGKLEAAGLVARTQGQGRKSVIALTQRGERLMTANRD